MHKRAQAIIIILWILIILTVLAVSIGHRVSLTLRISRYQRDSLKAHYLAMAGINRAIAELKNDSSSTSDALTESWADNPAVFQNNNKFFTDTEEIAEVKYTLENNGTSETKYGARDEDGKININTASETLLTKLFQACGVATQQEAQQLAKDILIWRGDPSSVLDPQTVDDYRNLGYDCKRAPFKNSEEIILVKGMAELANTNLDAFNAIKNAITVYGTSQSVNINTASDKALLAVLLLAQETSGSGTPSLANQIAVDIRKYLTEEASVPFTDAGTITSILIQQDNQLPSGDTPLIIDNAKFFVTSSFFRICASGTYRGVTKDIEVVYQRDLANPDNAKILYWHEN